jgi:hypothetical protein
MGERKRLRPVADRDRHTVPRSPVLDSYRSRARFTPRQWRGGCRGSLGGRSCTDAVGERRCGAANTVDGTVGASASACVMRHSAPTPEAVVASVTSDRRGRRTRLSRIIGRVG